KLFIFHENLLVLCKYAGRRFSRGNEENERKKENRHKAVSGRCSTFSVERGEKSSPPVRIAAQGQQLVVNVDANYSESIRSKIERLACFVFTDSQLSFAEIGQVTLTWS